jgi:hypothetical protein
VREKLRGEGEERKTCLECSGYIQMVVSRKEREKERLRE